MRAKLLTLATAAALAAPLAAAEPFRWQGKVAPGGAIEIKGVNGGIEARTASGNEVEVVATKCGKRSDPAAVRIEVVEHAGGATVCAVYPSRGFLPNQCRPGSGGRMSVNDNDVQVDFEVKVPAGVRFFGRTVNGGIDTDSLPGDAEAYTVNGGIEIVAAGHARAETVNGGIVVELPADAGAEVKAQTVNGSIELRRKP